MMMMMISRSRMPEYYSSELLNNGRNIKQTFCTLALAVFQHSVELSGRLVSLFLVCIRAADG
jgi:hypothetical protein